MARQARVDVGELLSAKRAKSGTTKIIGIDGHGGSGKSSLANTLAVRLGAEIVHTDDFASWDNPSKLVAKSSYAGAGADCSGKRLSELPTVSLVGGPPSETSCRPTGD